MCVPGFWGKLAQQEVQTQIKYFNEKEVDKFYSYAFNSSLEVLDIRVRSDTQVSITYREPKMECLNVQKNTSPVIAAFVS